MQLSYLLKFNFRGIFILIAIIFNLRADRKSFLYCFFFKMSDQNNFAHYGIYGLSNCQGGSCASQIVELVIASALIIWLIFEFIMQIKVHMRLNFSWQEVMLIQILLCLSFNICFLAWSNIILWYVLQSLMYQFYFTTLVYYLGKKYVEKAMNQEHRKPYIIALLVAYALFCFGQLGIFIYMVNSGLGHCKQIAELIVNGVMISLSVIFFVLAYQHEREELNKFQQFHVAQMAKAPLRTLWIWVLANIFGQAVSQIQSGLIYGHYGGQQCYPLETNVQIQVLGPIFLVLTAAIPFGSTLWFYSQRRKLVEERTQMSLTQLQLSGAQADVQNRIQLIANSTQRGVNSTVTLTQSLL